MISRDFFYIFTMIFFNIYIYISDWLIQHARQRVGSAYSYARQRVGGACALQVVNAAPLASQNPPSNMYLEVM